MSHASCGKGHDRGSKIKDLYSIIGENVCSKDDRDQGNVKITRVKKTELKMRPKPDRDAPGQNIVLQENTLEGRTS